MKKLSIEILFNIFLGLTVGISSGFLIFEAGKRVGREEVYISAFPKETLQNSLLFQCLKTKTCPPDPLKKTTP